MKKELLFLWDSHFLNVLIPKTRGDGYLKVPAGHHINERISHFEDFIECDVFGLDGMLSIDCGSAIATYPETRLLFENKAMPELSRVYGFPWREASHKEFWSIVENK